MTSTNSENYSASAGGSGGFQRAACRALKCHARHRVSQTQRPEYSCRRRETPPLYEGNGPVVQPRGTSHNRLDASLPPASAGCRKDQRRGSQVRDL